MRRCLRPLTCALAPLALCLVAGNVSGPPAGGYRYHAGSHALLPLGLMSFDRKH
jgi:hypothetical protein